jgi:hypothetical protein
MNGALRARMNQKRKKTKTGKKLAVKNWAKRSKVA